MWCNLFVKLVFCIQILEILWEAFKIVLRSNFLGVPTNNKTFKYKTKCF